MTTDARKLRHRSVGEVLTEDEYGASNAHIAEEQAQGDWMVADDDDEWIVRHKTTNPTKLLIDRGSGPDHGADSDVITHDIVLANGKFIKFGSPERGRIGFDQSSGEFVAELGEATEAAVNFQRFHQSQQRPASNWTVGGQKHFEYPSDSGIQVPGTSNNEVWVFVAKAPVNPAAIAATDRRLNFGATGTKQEQVFISPLIPTAMLRDLLPITAPTAGIIPAPTSFEWQEYQKSLTLYDANTGQNATVFDLQGDELTIYDTHGDDDSRSAQYHNFVLTLMRDASNNLLVMGTDARRRNAFSYNYTLEIYRLTTEIDVNVEASVGLGIPDVANQAELDAAFARPGTDLVFARITADFGSYSNGETYLRQGGAWHLIGIRVARGGLSPEQAASIQANQTRSTANVTRLNALDGIVGSIRYGAHLRVSPDNIDAHTDVQRAFTATLSNLDRGLLFSQALFDGGDPLSGSTVDNIRIIASDLWVVHGGPPLVNGAANPKFVRWQFGDTVGPLSINWEIDAQEAAQLGLGAGDDWVRFRLLFYRQNNEVARTNEYLVKIGETGLYPASQDDLSTAISGVTAGGVSYDSSVQSVGSTADAGDRDDVSRGDHVHNLNVNSTQMEFATGETLQLKQSFVDGLGGDGGTYTLAQRVGDLHIDLTPDVLQDTANPTNPGDVLNVRFQIDPGTDPFDSSNYPYYQIQLSGQPIGARTRWTGARLAFTIPSSTRDNLINNLTGANRSIDGEIQFFSASSGGTSVGSATFHITVLPPSTLPAYPAEGSRDNKIPKFDGDVLGWEEDGGDSSGAGVADEDIYSGADVGMSANTWAAMDVDEDIDDDEKYYFTYRGSDASTHGVSGVFKGSMLKGRVNGGGAVTEGGEANLLAIPFAKTRTGGALSLWAAYGNAAAQAAAAAGKTRIFVYIAAVYENRMTGLVKVGGKPGPPGRQGDPGAGLASVASDSTLAGDGTSSSPLGVANNGVAEAKLAAAVRTKLNAKPSVVTPRGNYSSGTAYAVGDIVTYNNHLYYVAVAVPSSNTSAPVDGSTWVLISADPTPDATTTRKGSVELSTQAEMNAGTAGKVPDAAVVKTYVDAQGGQSVRVHSENLTYSSGVFMEVNWDIPSSGDFYAVILDDAADFTIDLPRGILNRLLTATAGSAFNSNTGPKFVYMSTANSVTIGGLAKTSTGKLLLGLTGVVDPMPLEIWRR